MGSKTVASSDGGVVSYHEMGNGPGLIIVHGGMESWQSHRELAENLSDTFTVFLTDRRGRGATCPPGPGYGVQTEVADIEALAQQTGARYIFGVSSGAVIALQASLRLPGRFAKAALYEPPLLVGDGSRFDRLHAKFLDQLARTELAAALITAMEITEQGPALLRLAPSWLVKPVINFALSHDEQKNRAADESPALGNLVKTMECDFRLVRESRGLLGDLDTFRDTDVLLLSGTASRPYLIHSCEETAKAIAGSRHVRLKGLTHLGSGNADTDGKPKVVAEALKSFFQEA